MRRIHADLLLHGGDLTRDGNTHEFEYQLARDDLDTLPFPTFVIPGNMDVGNKHASAQGFLEDRNDMGLNITASRLDLFSSYFGPIHWTFVHRNVRFTGFFAAVAGSNLPQEERLWHLLEKIPSLPTTHHHVAIMHYWPFMETPEEPAWDIRNEAEYHNWYFSIDQPHRQRLLDLLKSAGVQILFCGHVHTGRPVQLVDGLRIYRTPPAGNTSQLAERWANAETRFGFHRCDVSDSHIAVTFIPGDDQCAEFNAYGPMGHSPLSQRDYSVVREHPPLLPDLHKGTRG